MSSGIGGNSDSSSGVAAESGPMYSPSSWASYPATTMATSAPAAASAAAATSSASTSRTSASGNAARMPASGVTDDGGRTSDEPWSPMLAASARRPIRAMVRTVCGSRGRTGRSPTGSFLSRTIDRAATVRARARASSFATT